MFLIEEHKFQVKRFRQEVIGVDFLVDTVKKKQVRFINFDNAASTPALRPALKSMEEFLHYYSGVHRGTGYKSLHSSQIYDESHRVILDFVKADQNQNIAIMVSNTTSAINKLSYRLNLSPADMVICTGMEHHSNDLPWRNKARVLYAEVDSRGMLDMDDLERKLNRGYPKVRLVTVCGASNVTGHLNPIHRIAEMAHDHKAEILVDGAQLVSHKPIDMKPDGDPQHIDYLAFSGHKIYAPFGTGVLIGPYRTFETGEPEYVGGGTVNMVTRSRAFWTELPDREEAGSPNVAGTYALAKTLQYLQSAGMEELSAYESQLTDYAVNKLSTLPGIKIYGGFPRIGVISFNLKNIPHDLVGAILCYEAGIGVRTGCFCAQHYVRTLLGEKEKPHSNDMYSIEIPGMVRISFGAYNTAEEIDRLVNYLSQIVSNEKFYKKEYIYSPGDGGYLPRNPAKAKKNPLQSDMRRF